MGTTLFTSYYLCPLGTIEIKANDTSVVSVLFAESVSIENPNEWTKCCILQLEEYFAKKRTIFELPLHQDGTAFQQKIWDALLKIPYGRTISYKELALKTGKAGSVRAVGTANGQNQLLLVVPCHRVIGHDGALTGYAGELWRKKWLIDFENGDKNGKQLDLVY
ncbi:MAG TPA: methylated-DNA--[protein]-cysteine S-methyltransferase [Cytophagaceae bacterium]|jgi:methylated-DNA-[protein]-cysteine S-methyltransferase|nr:methylated-DNA--[protein]-cysteine S-methyltransferase [Cytophagaceae bacterium]